MTRASPQGVFPFPDWNYSINSIPCFCLFQSQSVKGPEEPCAITCQTALSSARLLCILSWFTILQGKSDLGEDSVWTYRLAMISSQSWCHCVHSCSPTVSITLWRSEVTLCANEDLASYVTILSFFYSSCTLLRKMPPHPHTQVTFHNWVTLSS